MTITERIAAAIKHILDEDRRADRERIAELERDNNAVVQCCAELREAIDVYLAEIQRLTEKCAALVVENKRLSEYASGNWVDVPPPSDAGCLYPECGPTCRRDCPPASAVETPAVVKRTPKVGDRVRAKMSGRIGVVHKLFGGVALINQGGPMFEVLMSEIEVIE